MQLILSVHCHQPHGNLDWVVGQACDRAYLPLIEVLESHPELPISLHFSGSLLEWMDRHRPELISRLTALGNQVEWLAGGLYEPVLPMIPQHDQLAQLRLGREDVIRRFGQVPRGAWLAERVWDPHLPEVLRRADLFYVPLDDYHFMAAGLPEEALDGYYITDYQGTSLAVFPISEKLRYAIPYQDPDVAIGLLRRAHERNPDGVLVMGDDGEKLGMWPETFDWVWGDGDWMARFLAAVAAAGDWLRLTTFERYLAANPPKGTVSLPPGSYFEMTEWALPAETAVRFEYQAERLREEGRWEDVRPFFRGGSWPTFLVKYPEANIMYRKMLDLSDDLAETPRAPETARTELLRSQGNCAYWHGVFGGVYLPWIRADVHRRLINGRRLLDETRHPGGGTWAEAERYDWDGDGDEEVHAELPQQSWVLDAAAGGVLHYFDDKPSQWSVADVMSRRFEPYHPALARRPDGTAAPPAELQAPTGEQPPVDAFVYDRHPRRWLTDHYLGRHLSPDDFANVRYRDRSPLGEARFRIEALEAGEGRVTVRMSAEAGEARLVKTVVAAGRGLTVTYMLDGGPAGRFGPEFPIAVWEDAAEVRGEDGGWLPVKAPVARTGDAFELRHAGLHTTVTISMATIGELFAVPLRTLSKSDSGYDEIMQGVVLWPHWHTTGSGEFSMELRIEDA